MQKERPNNKHSAILVQVSVHCMDCIKAQSSIGKVFVIVFMHNIGITLHSVVSVIMELQNIRRVDWLLDPPFIHDYYYGSYE